MKWLTLDDRELIKQKLFWLSIIVPVLLGIIFGVPVWLDYQFLFSAKGYKTFLDISQLPLGIAALAIPFSILVSRLHSTKQTAAQIKNTEIQIKNTEIQIKNTESDNRTKLFLSHYQYFCDHISNIEHDLGYLVELDNSLKIREVGLVNKKRLYHLLYPDSGLVKGISKPDFSSLNDIITGPFSEYLNLLNDLFEYADDDKVQFILVEKTFNDQIGYIGNLLSHLEFKLGIYNSSRSLQPIFDVAAVETKYLNSFRIYLNTCIFIYELIKRVISFDDDLECDEVNKIMEATRNIIKEIHRGGYETFLLHTLFEKVKNTGCPYCLDKINRKRKECYRVSEEL